VTNYDPEKMKVRNISLRPLNENHLLNSKKWANDKLLQTLILRSSFISEETHQKWYQNILVDPSKIVFAIHEESSGNHIGNTGYYNYSVEHRRADFWILIGEPDFWGKGIGSSALKIMLHYGFEQLNLNKVCLLVRVENVPAIRIYTKCGFFSEGVLRQHYFIDNTFVDVFSMSIIKSEFEAKAVIVD